MPGAIIANTMDNIKYITALSGAYILNSLNIHNKDKIMNAKLIN
jgi:hypothetical protein